MRDANNIRVKCEFEVIRHIKIFNMIFVRPEEPCNYSFGCEARRDSIMIKKIKTMNNLAVFDNFNWDNSVLTKDGQPLTFDELNILYGRNYSGKTTLSRILRTLETHQLPEKYEDPQFEIVFDDGSIITQSTIDFTTATVRVFNEDFIRKNLRFLIDPDSEIEPFAILGADNEKIEREITALEAVIGTDEENRETGLYKQLIDLKYDATVAKGKFDKASQNLESKLSKKALDRTTGIKYNPAKFGDQNYNIAKIKQDIGAVSDPSYIHLSAEAKTEHESIIREQAKAEIRKLPIPSMQIGLFREKTTELLSRQIGASNKIDELLRDIALNEWVKKGKTLLADKDICAFCGNPISKKRWAEINAHFDEASKELETEIDALISEMHLEKAQLQLPTKIDKTKFYSKFFHAVDAFASAVDSAIDDYCATLDSIANQLQARKAQITKIVTFNPPQDNSITLKTLFEDFNKTIEQSNDFSSKLDSAKKASQKALRLQEVADFCTTIDYSNETQNISELKKKSEVANAAAIQADNLLKSKLEELQSKYRQLNDEEEGARRVNKYLNDYFGHNFVSLESEKVEEGEKRIRFRIVRNGKPAYNLSGGECSLISFCYFMAKLDDINSIGKKPIIWIDDPISSLDGNHIYFMYSLIVAILAKTGNFEQLFISTHNLDFLKYLRRLNSYKPDANQKPQAITKQYFFIEREGEQSKIVKMPNYLKDNATEFNYLFSLIYKCSKCVAVTDDNFDMLFGFGNNARKFLELLLYFQYPDDSEDMLQKLKRFFGTEEIPPILINRMFNEDSHGSSLEKASKRDIDPETIPVAKKIIDNLSKDEAQFAAFLKSIGEPCVH